MWIQNEVSVSQDHVDLIVHYSLEVESHLGPSPIIVVELHYQQGITLFNALEKNTVLFPVYKCCTVFFVGLTFTNLVKRMFIIEI